jgi:AraC-like DNA-binding protein
MRQAKWELLHTRKPVKQVAAGLGYDDMYFARLFKRATGCSPTLAGAGLGMPSIGRSRLYVNYLRQDTS